MCFVVIPCPVSDPWYQGMLDLGIAIKRSTYWLYCCTYSSPFNEHCAVLLNLVFRRGITRCSACQPEITEVWELCCQMQRKQRGQRTAHLNTPGTVSNQTSVSSTVLHKPHVYCGVIVNLLHNNHSQLLSTYSQNFSEITNTRHMLTTQACAVCPQTLGQRVNLKIMCHVLLHSTSRSCSQDGRTHSRAPVSCTASSSTHESNSLCPTTPSPHLFLDSPSPQPSTSTHRLTAVLLCSCLFNCVLLEQLLQHVWPGSAEIFHTLCALVEHECWHCNTKANCLH